MKRFRIMFAAGLLVAAIGSTARTQAEVEVTGSHSFDSLFGEWRVRHRRVQADTKKWVEFDGTYRAVGLRAYDAKTGQWSIRWLDGRYPSYPLDPPEKGSFENGVGTFYSDYVANGKQMRGRLMWSRITPTSAHWEQATSSDAGKTGETNWIMEFQPLSARSSQAGSEPAQAASSRPAPHDFDFLAGDWHVEHRYMRTATREWADSTGTCDNRPLMNGWANVEEHLMNAPSGAFRAVGLRAFDPKTERWSIWWLDGRDPSGDIDPPVKGRFEKGVGTFFGEITLNGKPMRVRFIWSEITRTAARWEQAYSTDEGKTWETNWTMNFRRR